MYLSTLLTTLLATTVLSTLPPDPTAFPGSFADLPEQPHASNDTLGRRDILNGQKSGLTILAYQGDECSGPSVTFPDVQYGYNYPAQIWSVSTSRALDPSEQLDFSMFGPNDRAVNPACGKFYDTALNALPAGCMQIQKPVTCFRFWHH